MTRIWRQRESLSSAEDKKPSTGPRFGIDFEVGRTLTLRPDYIVRGVVVLTILEDENPLCVCDVMIRFKAEESVLAKFKDAAGLPLQESIKSTIFDCSEFIWSGAHEIQGVNMQGGDYCPWEELSAGVYHFPFAVKLPPVNFPPSIEGPKGFSIRYTWQPVLRTAGGTYIEGPALVTPFVPTTFAPPAEDWVYKKTLYKTSKDLTKKKELIDVEAVLLGNVFAPGDELSFTLRLTNHFNGRITFVHCSLRKHLEGPLDKDYPCENHERSLVSTERRCNIPSQKTDEIRFSLTIPRKHRHVPPAYTGRHIRVHYTLRCVIQAEIGKVLTKMQCHEIIIPITLASYAHITLENCVLPTYLTHEELKLEPFFFDPLQDFPPDDRIHFGDDYYMYENNLVLSQVNGYLYDHLNALDGESSTRSPNSGSGSGMCSEYSIGEWNIDSFTLASSVGSTDRVEQSAFARQILGNHM
ncbi:3865_t:CDS:2 [Paraglomus occultum]|uniref:3865_t:CDS:1 n=1 Tax=Paraglomus occultum TaxID=144539 RepID=A0A9N8VMH5_9GLOM|nr:3865_t:CDS:2 [Paraglomus occultum]